MPQSRFFIQLVRVLGSTCPMPVTIPFTTTASGKCSNLKMALRSLKLISSLELNFNICGILFPIYNSYN
jgi:hypothetical protein